MFVADYGVKSPSAVDFSDINELADDERAMLNSLEAPRIEDGMYTERLFSKAKSQCYEGNTVF